MKRFHVLDGWRGICALLVALHHFEADGHFFALPFVRNSYLFVDFFFVLSGFVIAHSYGGRLAAWADVRDFAARRLARLWPLHAAVLTAFVALEGAKAIAMAVRTFPAENAPFTGATSVESIASNLLLVHGLGLHDRATWNFPSWSISTEFHAYLVFAALAMALPLRLPQAAAVVAAASFLVVALLSAEWIHTIADFGFFRCLMGFFIGVLVVHHRVRVPPLAEPLALAMVWVFVSAAYKGPLSMAAPLVFGVVVLVFAAEAGPVSMLLRTRPFKRLGEWSYSIYMIHTLLLAVIGRTANAIAALSDTTLTTATTWAGEEKRLITLGSPWATDGLAVAYLIAVVALSALTWRLIERPGQRWLTRRLVSGGAAPGPSLPG